MTQRHMLHKISFSWIGNFKCFMETIFSGPFIVDHTMCACIFNKLTKTVKIVKCAPQKFRHTCIQYVYIFIHVYMCT